MIAVIGFEDFVAYIAIMFVVMIYVVVFVFMACTLMLFVNLLEHSMLRRFRRNNELLKDSSVAKNQSIGQS